MGNGGVSFGNEEFYRIKQNWKELAKYIKDEDYKKEEKDIEMNEFIEWMGHVLFSYFKKRVQKDPELKLDEAYQDKFEYWLEFFIILNYLIIREKSSEEEEKYDSNSWPQAQKYHEETVTTKDLKQRKANGEIIEFTNYHQKAEEETKQPRIECSNQEPPKAVVNCGLISVEKRTKIKVYLSEIKCCQNEQDAVSFIRSRLPDLPIDNRSRVAGFYSFISVTKNSNVFKSRCRAKGCNNPEELYWYHPGGDRLSSVTCTPDYLVCKYSSGDVGCASCGNPKKVGEYLFECSKHPGDYR